MIQSIKKQIKLSLGDCGIGLGVTAGCVVFGLIFTQMMRVAWPGRTGRDGIVYVGVRSAGCRNLYRFVYGVFTADKF